ncbi:MAG: copper resistance protein B, partial [Novosphingobium sp.]
NKGDFHARLGASYDLRITNHLILQPDVELNAAFQDVPQLGIGAGFERLETGARLRYHITPEFAPYLGVHWERMLGKTARLARAAGDRASAVSVVAGVRFWF